MPLQKINNLDMYYELEGEGRPVVFISGMTMNHMPWKAFQVPAFTEAGYQCLVFDNRDTGQTSDSPESDYSTQQLADDTATLMQSLDLPAAHIVGYSMGGMVAQQMAIHHPDKVRSLVLLGTSARVGAYEHNLLNTWATAKQALSNEDFWNLMAGYILTWRFHENTEMMQRWLGLVTSDAYYQTPAALARQAAACTNHDTAERLSDIHVPTMTVVGEEDLVLPIRHSEFLHQNIPNSELILIPRCGHSGLSEGAATFNPAVLDFFSKH